MRQTRRHFFNTLAFGAGWGATRAKAPPAFTTVHLLLIIAAMFVVVTSASTAQAATNQALTITLTGIPSSGVVSGSIRIEAIPSTKVDRVVFTLRGPKDYSHEEGGRPYTLAPTSENQKLDTTHYPNGQYTLTVKAYDGSTTAQVQRSLVFRNDDDEPSPSSSGTRLRWRPPTLSNPQTIQLGGGYSKLGLDTSKDYILVMPKSIKRGATQIIGGRNVVIIGGHVQIPKYQSTDSGTMSCDNQGNWPASYPNHPYCRAFYFAGLTGVAHVEGVFIDASQSMQDAFAMRAPLGVVQIQNVRVEGIDGKDATWHGDVIQPWGGIEELRIDQLTAYTDHQGLQIAPDAENGVTPYTGRMTFLNVNIGGSGYNKVMASHSGCTFPVYMTFANTYIMPRDGVSLGRSAFPNTSSSLWCDAQGYSRNGTITEVDWPAANMSGRIKLGPPPNGDFVTRSEVGIWYRSPGYQ